MSPPPLQHRYINSQRASTNFNIASSSYTNISTVTFNCYLPYAGLLITDCRTIPRRITTTDTTPSVQANIIPATISSPAPFYCLQLTSRLACKSHALQLRHRASCHGSPCYRSPSCSLAGEYCSSWLEAISRHHEAMLQVTIDY